MRRITKRYRKRVPLQAYSGGSTSFLPTEPLIHLFSVFDHNYLDLSGLVVDLVNDPVVSYTKFICIYRREFFGAGNTRVRLKLPKVHYDLVIDICLKSVELLGSGPGEDDPILHHFVAWRPER